MSEAQPVVLVVAHEAQMRTLARIALEPYGYRVIQASTAAEGIRGAAVPAPDLVLLVLGPTGADAATVTFRIRQYSSLPVLVISARGGEQSKVRALDYGADDYLTKPFGAAELMAQVRVALRKALVRGRLANVVHVGEDIRIDMDRRIVQVRGKEVHLAPIEHKLLAALVRQAGRVVTYRELIEQVWGPNHEQRVSSMRVCMAALRQKLERLPARPKHLMTETGVGYRLRLEE